MDYKHKYNHLLELVEELAEAQTEYDKYVTSLDVSVFKNKILMDLPPEINKRLGKASEEIYRHLRINMNSLTIKLPLGDAK